MAAPAKPLGVHRVPGISQPSALAATRIPEPVRQVVTQLERRVGHEGGDRVPQKDDLQLREPSAQRRHPRRSGPLPSVRAHKLAAELAPESCPSWPRWEFPPLQTTSGGAPTESFGAADAGHGPGKLGGTAFCPSSSLRQRGQNAATGW